MSKSRFTLKARVLVVTTAGCTLLFAAYLVVMTKSHNDSEKSHNDSEKSHNDSEMSHNDSEILSLVNKLSDDLAFVRAWAASDLSLLGRKAHTAVPALIAALSAERSHSEARERWRDRMRNGMRGGMISEKYPIPGPIAAITDALKEIDEAVMEDQVPILLQTLAVVDSLGEHDTVSALSIVGAVAVPSLIESLRNGEDKLRARAAYALGEIGPETKAVLPALIKALNDKKPHCRAYAAMGLGFIGPEAQSAVPALLEALKDEDANVRSSAALAIGRMGPGRQAGTVPALLEALNDEDPNVRHCAEEALSEINETIKR